MERIFDIDVVNRFGDERQYVQLIAYIDPFVKTEHPDAIAVLGICYDFGYGVEQSYEKAMELFEKSANLGSVIGQFHYGWYLNLQKDDDTKKTAQFWKEKAALQGCIPAQVNLAIKEKKTHIFDLDSYSFLNIELDSNEKNINTIEITNWDEMPEEKKNVILIAAQQGFIEAQSRLADFLYYNENTEQEAINWYEKVGKASFLHTNVSDSELRQFRKDRIMPPTTLFFKEKYQWLNFDRNICLISLEKTFVNSCIQRACSCLGGHYFYCEKNPDKSIYWWSKVLEIKNDDHANYFLGVLKYDKDGSNCNYEEAFEHFNSVSEKSDKFLDALLYLALCYYNGQGTKKDLNKAFECFEKASYAKTKEGCLAKYYTALCYYYGDGVALNKYKALELINEAASIRNKDGKTDDDIARKKRFCGFDDEYFDKFDVQRLCGKACFFLGYLYEIGKDFPQDISNACELYERGLGSSYSPTEMLSVRDMLMEPDPEEKLLKQEMEWLQLYVEQAQELRKSKKAFDSIIEDQTTISNTLDQFSKQLQSFVAEQKAKASEAQDPNDIDISITSKGINDQVDTYAQNSETAHDIIEKERQWLVNYFKDNTDDNWWDKLDGYTRKSLIAARFFFATSYNSNDVDYSGACISASSALENELKQRFVDGYRRYLDSDSSLLFENWPSFMVDFKGRNGPKIKRDRFSLGDSNHICDTARDIQYFKSYLNTIKRNENMGKTVYESVKALLDLCADKKFLDTRNRAGHTEPISFSEAKEQLDKALSRLKELAWLTTNPMIK